MSSFEHTAEPDLTPILDLVFQLITFFMLVVNFKAAALDLDLKLPVVGSAQPVDMKGKQDLLILNVNSQGQLKVYGEPVKDIGAYIANEAQASRLSAHSTHPDLKPGDDLPSTVVIRADRGTRFSTLNTIITTCQKQGYRKFALKALNKEEE
jgi:biopolymer transport protein ExbD